jgi:hypothetical protein
MVIPKLVCGVLDASRFSLVVNVYGLLIWIGKITLCVAGIDEAKMLIYQVE